MLPCRILDADFVQGSLTAYRENDNPLENKNSKMQPFLLLNVSITGYLTFARINGSIRAKLTEILAFHVSVVVMTFLNRSQFRAF